MDAFGLSKREAEVAGLLFAGKSNKQIAMLLNISESTVEFHLTRIYGKLGVASRTEAILRLGQLSEPAGTGEARKPGEAASIWEGNPGESPVAHARASTHNRSTEDLTLQDIPAMTGVAGRQPGKTRRPFTIWVILSSGILLVVAVYLAVQGYRPKPWNQYQRECEFPDAHTVGQTIARSNASGSSVHGQFGTGSTDPWPAQPGSVTYQKITTPAVEQLYLRVRYAKNSPSAVAVRIYLDEEKDPRASFFPVDQGDWNRFTWTEPIILGSIAAGVHTIQFATDGQLYGVADLDQFLLTSGTP